jgi:beta-glucosidase
VLKAIHHVNLAHGAAVDVLRASVPAASIGAVHNRQPCYPASDAPEDRAAARAFAEHWNDAFPDPQQFGCYSPTLARDIAPYVRPGDMARIARRVDWFGLNHYSPNYIKSDTTNPMGFMFAGPPPDTPRTAIGWPIVPTAFRDTLVDIHRRFKLPIYVLENGTANHDRIDETGQVLDQPRIDYLHAYTMAMREAVAAGADIRGYFVWSLLDNFEWGSGYAERFGIVYVDYPTLRRIPKSSARWYADLISAHKQASGGAPR